MSDEVEFTDAVAVHRQGPTGETLVQQFGEQYGSKVELDTSTILTGLYSEATGKWFEPQDIEEEAVGRRFMPTFNKVRGTDFGNPIKYEIENSITDIIAWDRKGASLRMQVCAADPRPWRDLAKTGRFEAFSDLPAILSILKQAIEKKAQMWGADEKGDVVLLLDGWPVLPKSVLDELVRVHSVWIESCGFREVWYVPRAVDQQPTCLETPRP